MNTIKPPSPSLPNSPARQRVKSAHDIFGVQQHPLSSILTPKVIAVIGATENVGSVGRTLFQNLGRGGFTGVVYPVEWIIRADGHQFRLAPLLDDQENDTRLSTGAIYWEGAVRAYDGPAEVGRGYLELTGYGERLRLR